MPHDDGFQNGAVIDNRPEEEKLTDKKFVEFVAAIDPVNWIEKLLTTVRKFPIFNQNGSGSCVAQTRAKEMGIMRWLKDKIYVHFSASHIYQQRINKPSPGMLAYDANNITMSGATLEVLAPSQDMTDLQMDSANVEAYKKEIGKIFSIPAPIELPTRDIDTIASVIQKTGKGVMVWFFFGIGEWNRPMPEILDPSMTLATAPALHSVTAVDFTLYQGKKCLIIEDSWGTGFGINGQRIITEDFFKARNWYSSYLMNFNFDSTIMKPKYNFTKALEFIPLNNQGLISNPAKNEAQKSDVIALQDIMKFEKIFPSNVSSTGYYGATTAESVLKWQKFHNVAPDSELDPLQGRKVGPKTLAKLNELYN